MTTQFRKGVIELCVLGLIRQKDMYGYEIVAEVSKYISVNEGTIYPILRRLTKDAYFETYLMESSAGPARKYYKITPIGKIFYDELFYEWKNTKNMVEKILQEDHNE